MKLKADTGTGPVDVEIDREDRECRAVVNGREYFLDVAQPEPGVFLIKNGASVHAVAVFRKADGQFVVRVGINEFEIAVHDPKDLRASGAGEGQDHGHAEIRTAMPGKVVRIIKQVGDEVNKGDGVIVVEAMKMQNEMKAPKTGVVSEIRTAEGATVAAGDVLVVVE